LDRRFFSIGEIVSPKVLPSFSPLSDAQILESGRKAAAGVSKLLLASGWRKSELSEWFPVVDRAAELADLLPLMKTLARSSSADTEVLDVADLEEVISAEVTSAETSTNTPDQPPLKKARRSGAKIAPICRCISE
jgi:hypothetical protein